MSKLHTTADALLLLIRTVYTFCEKQGIFKSSFGEVISGVGRLHPGVKFSHPCFYIVCKLRVMFIFLSEVEKIWILWNSNFRVSVKFYWNANLFIHFHAIYGYFCALVEVLSSCDRDQMVCKAQNTVWLFYGESVLTPDLKARIS